MPRPTTASPFRILLTVAPLALAACGDHGGDVGTITAPQGRLWGARFSPSGGVLSVAYGDEDKLGTITLDTLTLRELTPGGSYLTGTAWSPSGDAIYFNGTDGIVMIDTDIGSTSMVNASFATMGVDVSPDGTRLAYGVNGGDARIYTLATQEECALARPCQAIRFAPSGNEVACLSGGALVTIALATGAETTIIDADLPFIGAVDWYSDGQALVVTTSKGIERVARAGGDTHLLFSSFAAVEVDLSPDDGDLVIGVNGQPDLQLVHL